MMKIDGRAIAGKILDDLKQKSSPQKFLAVFLVGNDLASENFIKQKGKIAGQLGVDFRIYKIEPPISNDQLKEKMRQIISSKLCGGAVLQLPLPAGLNASYVLNVIPPEKDVDILSERSLGSFYNGRSKILPPPVMVIEEIFKYLNIQTSSLKKVAVVGLGTLVGKPIASWFSGKVPEVFAFDKGSDFSVLENVDIIVLGTGHAGLIKAEMLKKGAGVIDFGYGTDLDGKARGDFDEESLKQTGEDYLNFYTPTPGGTGPILVACLFKNFYSLSSGERL